MSPARIPTRVSNRTKDSSLFSRHFAHHADAIFGHGLDRGIEYVFKARELSHTFLTRRAPGDRKGRRPKCSQHTSRLLGSLERRDMMISALVDCGVQMDVHLILASHDALKLYSGPPGMAGDKNLLMSFNAALTYNPRRHVA
jgi:hypothetical protein